MSEAKKNMAKNRGRVFDAAQLEWFKDDKGTLSERDVETSASHRDVSIIDIKALEELLKSDNIIEDYNKYCDESAKRVAQMEGSKSMQFLKCLQDVNSETSLIKLLRESGYEEFIDKEELLKYINLKIEIYYTMINAYIKMLDHNYKSLKISTSQYKKMKKNLQTGKDVGKTADKVLEYLEKNRKLWVRDWGADFTRFHGGKVFMNVKENLWDISGNARALYNISTRYDVVIFCHGTNVTPGNSLTKEEQEFVEKYKKLASKYGKSKLSKNDIEELKNEFTEDDKKIISKYSKNLGKLLNRYDINMDPYRYFGEYGFKTCLYLKDRLTGELKKNWGFGEPLKTPYGTFRDVNECLRACIAEGAKKINVLSCNPGHYEIAADIRKMDDIEINYQYYSVFIENIGLEEVLTEAVDIKGFFEKIKNKINSIKNKSKEIAKSIAGKFDKEIELPIIKLKGSKAEISKQKSKSGSELMSSYDSANNGIENKIESISKSIGNLKKAKEIINKL